MPSPRLQEQYGRLFRHFAGLEADTSLQQLADVLHCTRRHMRSLLAQMQAQGWLTWQSRAGRGQRSRLHFLQTEDALQQRRAAQLLDAGRLEQAAALLGEEQLAPLLRARLGRRWSQDRQVLGVPYYRALPTLYPGTPLRRSERHLVGQIFNGLTRINEENGEVEPALAHHWQGHEDREWHFHLRPAVRWHDGRELTLDDVTATLERLRALPLYAHLAAVRRLSPRSLALELSQADRWLPWLLADSAAMILPADHDRRPDFASRPVGTGPYRVTANDAHRLSLQAFDDYFGYRALLDQVDIWMLPQLAQPLDDADRSPCDLALNVAIGPAPAATRMEMAQEDGVYFLLCDGRAPAMQDAATRGRLAQLLSPLALMQETPPEVRRYWAAAASLLPRWHHSQPQPGQPAPLPPRLRLAMFEQHPEFRQIANAMARCLRPHGVTLECRELPYADWERGDAGVELWLGSVNFTRPVEYALPAWLLGTPLLRHALRPALPLDAWLADWRQGRTDAHDLSAAVVRRHWLLPLFHNWLRLSGPGQIEDLRLNSLGWFDFKSAWLRPDEAP